jgi:serine/threonine protein kinase
MAYEKKVYHRDIKPENILLKGGKEVKITDFGCSKFLLDKKMTAMTLVGTPYFLSPKLWEGFS